MKGYMCGGAYSASQSSSTKFASGLTAPKPPIGPLARGAGFAGEASQSSSTKFASGFTAFAKSDLISLSGAAAFSFLAFFSALRRRLCVNQPVRRVFLPRQKCERADRSER